MSRRALEPAALIVFAGFFIFSCSTTPKPDVATAHYDNPRPADAPTLGLIEHRGAFYRFEDLLDPGYRAASDDPFVKSFGSESHYATEWAGIADCDRSNLFTSRFEELQARQVSETIKLLQSRDGIESMSLGRVTPWAGAD